MASASPIQADSNNSQTVVQSANNAIQYFFNAVLEKDFNTMVNNSIDNRPYCTLTFRRQSFTDSAGKLLGYQIQSVQEIDSAHAIATVRVNTTEAFLSGTIEYPITYDGTKWVVDITDAKVIKTDGSFGFTVKTLPPTENPQSAVTPMSTLLVQYSGNAGNIGGITSGTFPGYTEYYVCGYQYPANNGTVWYNFMTPAFPWGNYCTGFITVQGTYPTNNWFGRYLIYTQAPPSPEFLNVTCSSSCPAAGDVYH
jgi:hypothetical protein